MPKDAPEPIRLPAGVWRDPAILALCRDHDANGLFRLARRHGVSNERLGYWTGADAAEASKRINNKVGRVTGLQRWQRIADGLNMPDDVRQVIGLAPRSGDGAGVVRSPDEPENDADFEAVGEIVTRARRLSVNPVDSAAIDQIELAIADIIERYEYDGPRALTRTLVELRRTVDRLLDSGSPAARERLLGQAARLSGLLAYAATNLGRFPTARAYGLEAFELASVVDSPDVQAWVRGTQSFTEYYAHNPRRSLEYAEDGQRLAAGGPETVRLIINGEARALGLMGDRRGVHKAVDRALTLSSRLDAPAHVTSCVSFGIYGEARTIANAATALLSVGDEATVLEQTSGLIDIADSSSSVWTRALVRLDRANALLKTTRPQPDEAAALGRYVVELPRAMVVESIRQRVDALVVDIGRWTAEPAVREFVELAAGQARMSRGGG